MFSPKLLVLVVIVTLIAGLFYFRSPSTRPTAAVQVTSQSITQNSASMNYQIKAAYPKIEGLTNTKAQDQINTDLYNLANKIVTDFDQQIDQSPPNPNLPASLRNQPNTLDVTYQVAQATDNYVSVQFLISAMQVGMAHPNNYNQTYTYSFKQQKVIALADLFKPNSNYLATLSSLTAADLTKQLGGQANAAFLVNQGTAPAADNFKNFLVAPNGLIIVFDPATVAPDAAGTLTVTLPFNSLPELAQ